MLNVVATLESDAVTTSETDVGTTLIFECATTWQRCYDAAVPAGLVKIFQIPHVIFQTTSQFFFKFCITL